MMASGVEFASAKLLLVHGDATVGIGVLSVPSGRTALPRSVLDVMKREIQDGGCHLLTGRFGDTAQQMAQLCTECGAVGQTPICQLWHAERLGLITYPMYFFIFRRCRKVSVPKSREAPKLTELMGWFDDARILMKSMLKIDEIPKWENTPAETELNLGHCKQKAVGWNWWKRGVHQLVMWIGTARTGQGSKKRQMKERQIPRR